ncbi:hypothetical protein [Deinococcus apachensis]|uniref:hypothetical protein n=1 Tax=Deinococcus apachensis TaxID=309886 RepID=UPI00036431F4|nr:hypothetical protein [Deinococcus apachensis]
MSLEIRHPNADYQLYVNETVEGKYGVESGSPPGGTTFTLEETALIVARALQFAGLQVREPGK